MNKVSYGREQEYPRVMTGFGTGRVIESKNDKFAVGSLVSGIVCSLASIATADYSFPADRMARILPCQPKPGNDLSSSRQWQDVVHLVCAGMVC